MTLRTLHTLLGALAMTAVVTVGAGACTTRERVCGDGQYPAKAVGNATGRTCQDNGKQPPDGYVRYPDGKVPKYIDDKWDKYWRTKIVDKNGTIVN